jgi:ribosomal protein L35
MPKLKSRKLLTNRLRITKSGKILRRQSFRRHLKSSKSAKRLKNLKRTVELKGFYAKKVRKVTGTVTRDAKKVAKVVSRRKRDTSNSKGKAKETK